MIKATVNRIANLLLATVFMCVFAVTATAQHTFVGDNVVANGDFSSDSLTAEFFVGADTTAWAVEGNTANFDVSITNGELAFTNMQETANQYDYQVNQPFTADQIAELEKGGTFELTFDARTTADEKTFHVFLGQVGGDWARYWASPGDGDVTVTNNMDTYTLTTDITETWEAMRLGFEVATDTSSLFIDNVSLRKTSPNILKDGGLVVADTISSNWITEGDGTNANFSADNGAVKISDILPNIDSFAVQIRQELDTVQIDSIYAGPYEISFDAKTSADAKNIQVFVGNNGTDGDWTNFAPVVELTNEMTNYVLPINVSTNWAMMKVGFEVAQDTSSVWLDNVILNRVTEVAPDVPGISLEENNNVITVGVTEVSGAATYDVYFSNEAFTVTDSASFVGTIDPENGLTLNHSTDAPHPSVANEFTAHYGVVAVTEKGTASEPATQSIVTGMTTAENYAVELTQEAVGTVSNAFGEGVIPDASALASFFPESYSPFTIDTDNSVIVAGVPIESNADLSMDMWIGFNTGSDLLVIYTEVMDDSVVYATEADGSGGAWNFDSWEMGIGNYSPESFIEGSTHEAPFAGANPDWQLRGGGIVTDDGSRGFIHGYGFTEDRINGEIPNSQTLVERTDDGYRTLTVISTVNLATGEDVPFDFPTGEEVALYPMQISMNDNDAGARDIQAAWGSRAVNGDWWQRPQQWNIVAFVGLDAVVTSNEEIGDVVPGQISLKQNYPNPFNPTTNISFNLPAANNVTLEVFNLLGQKVATLLNNEALNAGTHSQTFNASNLSTGLYFYRLNVGSSFTSSKKMMLIK